MDRVINNACQEAALACHWHMRISWLDPLENGISITGVLCKAKNWGILFSWKCVDMPQLVPCALRALWCSAANQRVKEPCWKQLYWLQKYSIATLLWPQDVTQMWPHRGEKGAAFCWEWQSSVPCVPAQLRRFGIITVLVHHCSLPLAAFSWDAGSKCCLNSLTATSVPSVFLNCPCDIWLYPKINVKICFNFSYNTFSSETLLSRTGLDYNFKLAVSSCCLSIHEWNPSSSEDDAHQQYSTAASLSWINKTCSSFLKSVIFSVWSLSHLYLMQEAAL